LKNVVGVRFRDEGKVYTFDAGDLPLQKGQTVILQTENGPAVGTLATEIRSAEDSSLPANLKRVLRVATEADEKARTENRELEVAAHRFCLERIRERKLPMKLIAVECQFDQSKVIFSFTAESRVDFRELVKDLVQKFRTRIELRQIGARQETRLIKGLGVCGREVCCGTMLHNLDRVSVKMAKEQSMSLNPEKISGLCGRLMCCLSYEYDSYMDMKKDMPKCGKAVQTPQGKGKVIRQNVLAGEVSVFLEDGSEKTFCSKDVCPLKAQPEKPAAPPKRVEPAKRVEPVKRVEPAKPAKPVKP